jgi:hypothetical protein
VICWRGCHVAAGPTCQVSPLPPLSSLHLLSLFSLHRPLLLHGRAHTRAPLSMHGLGWISPAMVWAPTVLRKGRTALLRQHELLTSILHGWLWQAVTAATPTLMWMRPYHHDRQTNSVVAAFDDVITAPRGRRAHQAKKEELKHVPHRTPRRWRRGLARFTRGHAGAVGGYCNIPGFLRNVSNEKMWISKFWFDIECIIKI